MDCQDSNQLLVGESICHDNAQRTRRLSLLSTWTRDQKARAFNPSPYMADTVYSGARAQDAHFQALRHYGTHLRSIVPST